MKYTFHPEAELEFLASIDYYEARQERLGYQFSKEVYSTIGGILEQPELWPFVEKDIRRRLTKRFPFGVLYSIEAAEIFILAVAHLSRDPNYWKMRKKI